MSDEFRLETIRGISDVYLKPIKDLHLAFHRHTTIKILVVVDGSVSLTESSSGFGVGRVIRLLRESHVGCKRFTVDTARRENSGAGSPTYQGFRFDRQENGSNVIDKYHEIWCFGFNPDNFAQTDANITIPNRLPMEDNELKVLTEWMNVRKGGLLAMGDHDYLGASMCHRIPRIRSMRRWTNAQNVPPIGGLGDADTHLRHDTNQPFTANQMAGTEDILFEVQEDSKPQPISWVPWVTHNTSVFQWRSRPHPILCHPVHGPINVMPDHPHEGWCYENDEIDLSAPLNVPGLSGNEYPAGTMGPTVIAYGTTTPNPPYRLEKGPSPQKRFGMISVYDGHKDNIGRVATDSTWHHWFDENIFEIEQAGGVNWDKISRYYLNVAVWLAPPGIHDYCLIFEVLQAHFTYLGFQEFRPNANVFDLGRSMHTYLAKRYGPCWVTSWVLDKIRLVDADIWAWLKDRLFWKNGIPTPGEVCLSCPPFEAIELAVLGGLVKHSFEMANGIKERMAEKPDMEFRFDADDLVKRQMEGVQVGLKDFRTSLSRSLKSVQRLAR